VRQAHRDKGVPLDELGAEVHPHDIERALDAVYELVKLGGSSRSAEQCWPAEWPALASVRVVERNGGGLENR
jgi:hypothetical protein